MKNNPSKGLSTVDAKPPKQDPMDDYEARGHYDTLMSAHHIMNDPDKMAKVKQIAGRKAKAATAINDMVGKPMKTAKPTINSFADIKAAGKAMRAKKTVADTDEDGA